MSLAFSSNNFYDRDGERVLQIENMNHKGKDGGLTTTKFKMFVQVRQSEKAFKQFNISMTKDIIKQFTEERF